MGAAMKFFLFLLFFPLLTGGLEFIGIAVPEDIRTLFLVVFVLYMVFGRTENRKTRRGRDGDTAPAPPRYETNGETATGDLGFEIPHMEGAPDYGAAKHRTVATVPPLPHGEDPADEPLDEESDELRQRPMPSTPNRYRKYLAERAARERECDDCGLVEEGVPSVSHACAPEPKPRFTTAQLRQAIIVREILDKPLALRRRR